MASSCASDIRSVTGVMVASSSLGISDATTRPGRLQVDDKLEFRRLQDRQVSRLSAIEDLTGVGADLTIHAYTIGVVAHQAAGFDSLAGRDSSQESDSSPRACGAPTR